MKNLSYYTVAQTKTQNNILPIMKKTITSLLTISFKIQPYSLLLTPLTLLPLEDEHIRRAVHTTKNTDNDNLSTNDSNEMYNKSWMRSTDLKRILKAKLSQ